MKHYNKKYEDLYPKKPEKLLAKRGVVEGSFDDYIRNCRDLFFAYNVQFFDSIIKIVWLEAQFKYNGSRRVKRNKDSPAGDVAYRATLYTDIGITPYAYTRTFGSRVVNSYIKDFFPLFFEKNPFLEPDYFAFPYKNIGLDHMGMVYQMPERLELLDHAEKTGMKYGDFVNWVGNYVSCVNEESRQNKFKMHWGNGISFPKGEFVLWLHTKRAKAMYGAKT